MKSTKSFVVVSVLVASVFVIQAGIGYGGIAGTKHDLRNMAWNTKQDLCGVCHTPHNAKPAYSPLWTHEVTTAAFTVYTSPTMNAIVGAPSGTSKLCLSCHDGTVALENYGGVTTGTNFIAGGANVGTDLSNDHPFSFTYDTALSTADPGLFNPATTSAGLPGVIGTIAEKLLFAGKLECASCHDVHDNQYTKFLRKPNTGSALCLTCHNK